MKFLAVKQTLHSSPMIHFSSTTCVESLKSAYNHVKLKHDKMLGNIAQLKEDHKIETMKLRQELKDLKERIKNLKKELGPKNQQEAFQNDK